ncbi:MAG: 4-hydroxy-tetrahydrodipicolinate reductase, partial [bacterium]
LPQNVIDDLKSASAEIGIFTASNFSVGIALCGDLASQAAKSLPTADIEIIEAHHKNKADAPSGTALELAKKIVESRNLNFEKDIVYCRDGKDCSRKPNEIGISAVRGGGIIGEHRILLALPYETLIIEHRAISRDVFAGGALDAAEFVAGKTGYFGINDLLRK